MNSRITKSLLLIFPWIALALAAPIGCDGKGKKTADQVAVGTDGGQQTIATTVDCPNTGVVGADGKETAASPANLYRQYHGGTPTFLVNPITTQGDFVAGGMGNYLVIVKSSPPSSMKYADLRSGPILGLKWIEGKMIVGTLSNLQVCSLPNPAQVVKVEDCKVYDRAGGVSDVDVLGDNIYFTTVSGDFGYISMSTMDSQSGCGRLLYSAAEHIHEKTKTPMRAFRVAAADAAYFLTRNNSGDTGFNFNSLIGNLMDWTDPITFRAIKRETALYRYAPGSAAPEKIDVGDANYHYLMDDLVGGPNGKVHASFVAPREADVKAAQDCSATVPPAPCPGFTTANASHVALAYFLNSKQGLLSIQGNEVKHFEADPSLNINANDGCSPDGLAASPPTCLRAPNIAFLFFNRLAVMADSVIMRGMFGFARLKGESFEVVAGVPMNNESPALGFPFAIGADSQNTYAGGFFMDFKPSIQPGMVEKGGIPGPDLTSITTFVAPFNNLDDISKNSLYAGSDQHAYVHADDSFQRIKFSDPTDQTLYDILKDGGSDFTPAGLFPVAVQVPQSGGTDHVVVFHEQGKKYFLAFYEPNNPAPIFKSTQQVIVPPYGTVLLGPIAYVDDFIFVALTSTTTHSVNVFDADWTASSVTKKTFFDGDNYSFGILSVDKIPEGYRVYLWSAKGISVLTFPYDSATDAWDTPNNKKATIPGPANFKGVTAGGGLAYFLMEDGSVQVFNLDGTPNKTIAGAVALRVSEGEKVLVSITPRFVNGRLVIPAILYSTTTPTLRMATAVVDLDNDANKNTYELPFLFANNYGDKFFGSTGLNGIEAFDLSKPNTDNFKGGSIDLGGAKVSTPGEPVDVPQALEGEATGDTPTGNRTLGGGGGWTSCNLSFGDQDFSVTSIFNLMGWMLLIGAAISGWMLIRRKSS